MEGEANSKLPPPEVGAKIESSTCPEELPNPRKKKNKSRKRFSDEQIKSLELIFKSETKLEPRKKLQVARELGLQPRQVAIWFQNRRARWKSKEIEQSYRVLRANYENLHSRFESLKKEKQSLHAQLQNLRDLLEKHRDRGCNKDLGGNSTPCGTDGDTHHDLKTKRSFFNDGSGRKVTYLDDEEGGNAELFLQEEAELLNMDGKVDGSMVWYNFDSKPLFDQSSRSSNWWDSWT